MTITHFFAIVIYWHMFYASLRAPEPFQTQRCRNGIHTCRRGVFVHHCTDEVTCPVPQSISQPQAIQFAAWAAGRGGIKRMPPSHGGAFNTPSEAVTITQSASSLSTSSPRAVAVWGRIDTSTSMGPGAAFHPKVQLDVCVPQLQQVSHRQTLTQNEPCARDIEPRLPD